MRFTTRPELSGTFGMVSSTHWLASAAGMSVLERGGNAFDAAVAAGFTLQVVEPHQNGPGGDLPLIFAAPGQRPTVLCAQGPAPAAATVGHFRELGLSAIPGTGTLAAAVPGATLGWLTLLRDKGTFPLADVLHYAIGHARHGFPVTQKISEYIAKVQRLFTTHWTTSAAVHLPHGRAPRPGEFLHNPALADTFERLVAAAAGGTREAGIDRAVEEWTTGGIARAMTAFCATEVVDSTGERRRGLLRADDLAGWRPSYENTVSVDYRGHRVHKPGPWSQGPVLLQQLGMLAGDEDLAPGTADHIHRVVEVSKLAFADRDAWYGDSPDVPLDTLLSPAYCAERRRLVGPRASRELRPGSPEGREPVLPAFPPEVIAEVFRSAVGEPNAVAPDGPAAGTLDDGPLPHGEARTDTVHVDVVDRAGTMVSAMPSGGWLHSSPVIPELGFPLGTRLQMAWLEEGLPNTLAPGKRPRTTLSPTVVTRGDEPVLAFGTPGGDQQDQWQLNFLLNVLDGGMNLQEAIDFPQFHSTHAPSSFYPHESRPAGVVLEGRTGDAVLAELAARGHVVQRAGEWEVGRLCAVGRAPGTGRLYGAANPRGMQGYAAGR
ncbi:gamma-glutamyltransferase family protein [Streptomyces sp. RKND-216]|uniref:gamma-glutamyltransferase family protein n=1 Tax=Streptomyces sp. RKND-216 TaxID=2562581 RepID=UPI00109E162D|nr:gamma-glutamyltransferase family protein [Streptomyces sp. RKND-216]THA24515.1 gamma-glutamyltransferase family protein [Streptomyces sp. RKND-216]